ncbi:SIMPL domain-containing protein [Arthrobacter psychrolactophilus]
MTVTSSSALPSSITVSGHGLVQATPDYFTINLGIEATQATVREAYAQAGDALNAVSTTLLAHGVARELISSSALNVRVETRWQEGSGSVVTGYTVSSTLAVSLRYDQGAEDVIAAVVDTGNNNVRITGLTPVVSDPTAAQDAARAVAWADARRAAELYAQLAGRSLGEPLQIVEGQISDSAPRPMMARAAKAFDSSPMAIEPGQSSITMTVQVTWLLN